MRPYVVYISGPISLGGTATPYQIRKYKRVFRIAAKNLYSKGYIPFSPLKNEAETWSGYMRKGIIQLMNSDRIFLLPDWEKSKGAVIERDLAVKLSIPVWLHSSKTYGWIIDGI